MFSDFMHVTHYFAIIQNLAMFFIAFLKFNFVNIRTEYFNYNYETIQKSQSKMTVTTVKLKVEVEVPCFLRYFFVQYTVFS